MRCRVIPARYVEVILQEDISVSTFEQLTQTLVAVHAQVTNRRRKLT